MTQLNLDGTIYEIEQLPESAQEQLACIQFIDAELVRLDHQVAVHRTARNSYIAALRKILQAQSRNYLE